MYMHVVRTPDGFQTDQEPGVAEKVVKYFPAEGLALYCLLEPAARALGPSRPGLLWAALGLSLLFCAVTLHMAWRVTRASHVLISCTALLLYVAALELYQPGYAAAGAVAATALLMLVPSPRAPRRTHPDQVIHLDQATVPHPRSGAGSDPHR